MIKNIILDVGGILFDDSKQNIEKILGKKCDIIYKNAYGKGFNECLLGEKTIKEYINSLTNLKDFESINYILDRKNLRKTYPLIRENFDYIKNLKQKGYRLYLLTNITEESYIYINETINIDMCFDGGIYSYREHLIKPNQYIYKLMIDKYELNKEETIFFDDKIKNVEAAKKVGINAFVFESVDDIKNNL